MSALLFRLGRSSARHPFRVIAFWLIAAVAIVVLQGAAGGHFDDSFRVPGVESQRAADILTERFPARAGQTSRIVVHVADGRLDDAEHKPIIDRVRQQLSTGHDVSGVTDPFATQSAALSQDGRTAYVDVAYALDKLTVTQLHDAQAAADAASAGGVQTELTGELALLDKKDPSSELIGIAVAIIVLLVAFGSVVAMGLPIVTALMSLFVGAAGVGVLSAFMIELCAATWPVSRALRHGVSPYRAPVVTTGRAAVPPW